MQTDKKVLCDNCMTNISQNKLIPPPPKWPTHGWSCPICGGYISHDKATR